MPSAVTPDTIYTTTLLLILYPGSFLRRRVLWYDHIATRRTHNRQLQVSRPASLAQVPYAFHTSFLLSGLKPSLIARDCPQRLST